MSQPFYFGDPWELEAVTTNTKTGVPVEPTSVSAMIYPPAARGVSPTRAPIGPVTLPKIEANVYEAIVVAELDEAGQWLAVVTSPAPYKKVLPVPLSVSALE